MNKLPFCSSTFIAVFDKQINIPYSTGSISRPISSRDNNATDQEIAMDRYESYSRKLDIFFSGKQHGAVRTDQKVYSLLIYDFCMVVTVFKIAASLLIFLATRTSLPQPRKQKKSNYKFW